MNNPSIKITAVIPAAGIGKRMQADKPKQYLVINNKTILEHTVAKLLQVPEVTNIILSVASDDPYIRHVSENWPANVKIVQGGAERVDSVLAALQNVEPDSWVMVHDAARPCVPLNDINKLIAHCLKLNEGGILAMPVRDTMKRSDEQAIVQQTVTRANLWHAHTPQMFKNDMLVSAIQSAQLNHVDITDEASAIESVGGIVHLIESQACNIKITQPDDLTLAEYFLTREAV
ncbi:2-C-methyl-D-erythritol 4-phosphate cytidylyltransferase [Algibacillus agarilyticus]|uniref:2-C-methyl-D-erythritol 4-phosphate cytidylyltransferase n=1 Tax=Algibacillus agarilyticus TaxID=2234133 RepID=UPI000DD0E922|nr:2-C-methyl-D-erythritol 4-phosphate cytidylyltransferase [Algibacillus agarilyticus]